MDRTKNGGHCQEGIGESTGEVLLATQPNQSHDTYHAVLLTLKVLVVTIDAQGEGMGDVGSARYEPALLPPCPTIRVLSYSN